MKAAKRITVLMAALMMLILTVCMADTEMKKYPDTDEDAKYSVVRVVGKADVDIYQLDTSTNKYQCIYNVEQSWTGSAVAVGKAGEAVSYFVTNRHVAIGGNKTVGTELQIGSYVFTLTGVYDADNGIYTASLSGDSGSFLIQYGEASLYITTTDVQNLKIANVHKISDKCDLAIIKVADKVTDRTPIIIRKFEEGTLGNEKVSAIGFPAISDYNDKQEQINSRIADVTLTRGDIQVVKSHAATGSGEQIQHGALISGGNSGGALVDANGYLVGINYATWVANSDYALAVSSNEVTSLLDSEGIPYATTDDVPDYLWLYIAGGVVILGIAAVVVILLVRRPGSSRKDSPRQLVGAAGALAGRSFAINGKVVIGCDKDRCGIAYPAGTPGISRCHCQIETTGDTVKVTDIGSSYGTWIDGVRLEKNVPVVMRCGQRLYLGSKKENLILK